MHHTQRTFIYIAIAVVIIGLAALFFMLWSGTEPSTESGTPIAPAQTVPPAASDGSLGGQILERAQNPIQDKVPNIAPAANPIEGAYNNPFE